MKEKGKKTGFRIETRHIHEYAILALMGLAIAFVVQREGGIQEFLGGLLVVSVLLLILYRDIMRYKPQYTKKQSMIILLGLMVLGTIIIEWLAEYILAGLARGLMIQAENSLKYGIPVAAGAMLVTLLFDFHTAIVFSFIVSIISGIWQADPLFTVYAFAGSLTASFSMIRCKKRTAILRGGAYVLAANFITLTTILLYNGSIITEDAPIGYFYALISAVSTVAMVSLALPILEYLFKVSTDISLLELLDLDHPLMKNLMISAPGTYHHSLIVGSLVESCAEAVGVNPLLVRAGAYYHDIGKIKMPEYFIENQTSGLNKHERLTPHMSSMILISHVKEGVELANYYKLPESVIDIVQQHHGSALITYFYEKAKGLSNGTELSVDEYKYPGPKPQTRSAALIMMADAVEASSRVLNEPNPARITALVEKIINHIYLEGQLDECELTFKDINEIKKNFIYILTGILHKRTDYPGFDFSGETKESDSNGKQPSREGKTKLQADKERLPEGPKPTGASKGRA